MQTNDKNSMFRFVIPVALENLSTIILNMVVAALFGKISHSSLAATSTGNLVVTFYGAIFSLLVVGSAVIVAFLVGAEKKEEASRVIEQTIFLSFVLSLLIMILSLCLAGPLMRILMPNAEPQLYQEAVTYFRVLSLCLPGMLQYNALASVLRASGNSRMPFLITTTVNIVQIIGAYCLIVRWPLGVVGAGLTNVLCRTVGGIMSVWIVLREREIFHVKFRNVFRPHLPTIRRIMRVGTPPALENSFVQVGYLVANSMAVGLGTQVATTYQIANTLQTFSNVPMGIGTTVATTLVGQSIGAGEHKKAKRQGYKLCLILLPIMLLFYLVLAIFSPVLAPMYSQDPVVIAGTVTAMWVLLGYAIPGLSVNIIDPCLRAGGDAKFVMIETLIGVWAVRLPLMWLFCYHLDMGVVGIILADILCLVFRGVAGQIRYAGNRWLKQKI